MRKIETTKKLLINNQKETVERKLREFNTHKTFKCKKKKTKKNARNMLKTFIQMLKE